MNTGPVARNLDELEERIARAAEGAGRSPSDIRIVAVSKTVDADHVREAYEWGQRAFGENRVQELTRKAPLLPEDCEWHMIGHLQRNKVRPALQNAAWIHSADSTALIERIERIAEDEDVTPRILLQLNVSGEESKYGIPPDKAPELLETALNCRRLECRGLMTMAPYECPEKRLHEIFAALRTQRDRLARNFDCSLAELSMGMSGDFETAIAEGATLVRIGTAVFGNRSTTA